MATSMPLLTNCFYTENFHDNSAKERAILYL